MSYFASRPEQSTSAEAALLTQLNNLATTPTGYAIAKNSDNTFSNVLLSGSAIVVAGGGTGLTSMTPYAVLLGGTTTTGPLQQVSGVGTSGQVLTSNGAGAAPSFQTSSSSGTVTTVSVATANGFSGTVANATTTPAITIIAGAITPTSVNGLTITTSSGTLTITNLKTFAVSNSLTLAGTDGKTLTVSNNLTLAGTDGKSLTLTTGLTVTTNDGTIAFSGASKTLTVANSITISGTDAKSLVLTTGLTVTTNDGTIAFGAASKTATFNNSITFAGTDSTTMTFPASSATVAGLGITQTFTGINTFTPAARSSGSASYFTINAPADTGITTTAESIGINHVGATRTWADGTTTTQREYLFQAPTYNKTTTSAVFTKAATLAVSAAPTAGTGVTITNGYAFWVQAGLGQFDGGIVTTTINSLTITTSTGTITLTNSKTLTVSDSTTLATNAITLGGGEVITFSASNALSLLTTGTSVMTFPTATDTVAVLGTAQTYTALLTQKQVNWTINAITASSNAATVPISHRLHNVTNSSAATLTITMTTTSAVDGQLVMVRIFDFSAVAQTITWVNTENSTATAPILSNGSTTLPITAGFQYNSATSKWRCIASA